MAARSTTKRDNRVFQLKVTLKYSKPPIWRRVLVKGNTALDKLHDVLQVAMGWTDSHMHQFQIGGRCYAAKMSDGFELEDTEAEHKFRVGELGLREKSKFVYEYDFGDGWMHDIVVEKFVEPEKGADYPVLIDGARACPPEDCGGLGGFYNLLQAVADPKHPEHEELREWLSEGYDPASFDLNKVNHILAKRRKQPRQWTFMG